MMIGSVPFIFLVIIQLFIVRAGKITVNVHGIVTSKEDAYICNYKKLTNSLYPVGFEPHSKAIVAHHMLVFGCNLPNFNAGERCLAPCLSSSKILYAWARDAPTLHLPRNVSFEIGPRTGFSYVVIQIHYKNRIMRPDSSGVTILTSPKPLPLVAGVMLMSANQGSIPPHRQKRFISIACRISSKTQVVPFAFRVHAHDLARTNFAYRFSESTNTPELLVRASPQWPQAFYPSKSKHILNYGDILVGACVYDSMTRDRSTRIGFTHKDEMCNVYIMYSRRREDKPLSEREENVCDDGISLPMKVLKPLWRTLPKHAFDYLPTSRRDLVSQFGKKEGFGSFKSKAVTSVNESMTRTKEEEFKASEIKFHLQAKLGQVSGIAFDSRGRLFVFHRAGRVWDDNTFDDDDHFIDPEGRGPIQDPTLLVVDSKSGRVLESFGANFFYLPHGLSIDDADNVWVTDVALHQAFRFDAGNFSSPSLTVGTRFMPGRGPNHLCKPTDVAVMSNGRFFVADGYCNSRIVVFSSKGRFLQSWGSAHGEFEVPHSLALINSSCLCCADRERARIECFRPQDGASLLTLRSPALGSAVYAICKAKEPVDLTGPVLHAVGLHSDGSPQGVTFTLDGAKVLDKWGPSTGRPHDVDVSGERVFVAQLDPPFRVSVFKQTEHITPVNQTALESGASLNETWHTLKANIPLIVGVVLVVPLLTIIIGATLTRIHRHNVKGSRPYKERERAKFKALINEDDSGSEGEMALMERQGMHKYLPSRNPRNT